MNNKDLIKVINKNNKMFLDDLLSISEHLNKYANEKQNKNNLLFSDYFLNYELIESLSLLLTALKNDKVTSNFFKQYGITFNSLENKLNELDLSNINYKKMEELDSFPDINLRIMFFTILVKIQLTCFLEEEVSYDIVENYQLFDALIDGKEEELGKLLNQLFNLDNINIFEEYQTYIHDYYYQFAETNYGIDIEEEARKEEEIQNNNFKEFDFDEVKIEISNDSYYLTFKENANLDKIIYHVNRQFKNDKRDEPANIRKLELINSIKLPESFMIKRIDIHENLDENKIQALLFTNDIVKSKIPVEIKRLNDDKTFVIWLDKEYTFNVPSEEIKNEDYPIPPLNNKEDDINLNLCTPFLNKFGFDLTNDTYIKDPSIGRDNEIRKIEQILCYPERDKSIIITGISGSGKTALVKGLAYRIQKGNVPKALKDLRIISIDAASIVSGCRYVGMLEERMKGILDEASTSKNIIIFMDEIHQALGAGAAENDPNSVSEILKPYLDYGRVRLIGATTTEEYENVVTKDEAFKTRFKKININEPDNYIVYQILDDLINTYNNLGEKTGIYCPKLNLNDNEKDLIINWLIDSTKPTFRSYNDRASNPRLVLDIIKEAYAIASLKDEDEVDINDIKEALLNETRLYDSSKERQIEILENTLFLNNYKKDTKIIDFSLIKKK